MRHQTWATEAHSRVHGKSGLDTEREFATLYKKMPGLIQRSGALQAVAFLRSRGKKPSSQSTEKSRDSVGELVANDLAEAYMGVSAEALATSLRTAGTRQYMQLNQDLLDVAIWFRRYARMSLVEGEDHD